LAIYVKLLKSEEYCKKILLTCWAKKDDKLGKSVENDIVKTFLRTEWNLKISEVTSFCWRILLSIIRMNLDGTLAFENSPRHALLVREK
jgi:hypothetical protein